MEDSQILQHFFDRSEQAIADTAEAYGGYCASVARNILDTPEDVEEVLSDTWLRAWNTIPPEKPENLKLYLARITRNLSIDRFRARSREKRGGGETALALDELAQCLGTGETPEQQMEARELRTAVNRFLGSLPRRDRGIFLLRYFYLESAQTIARRYGLRPDNVRAILSRTRRKLKQHLLKEGFLNG